MASGAQALIAELDASLAGRSNEQRFAILRKVCDLFLLHADACAAEHVSVFDDVMIKLMEKLPREALVELSGRLAAVDNAPANVARRLATDDDIAVAGPILAKSNALSDRDLALVVAQKGAPHVKAVLGRSALGEAVSDALLERNDLQILRKIAANEEVRFSEVGIVKLVYAAKSDKGLSEVVLRRKDIPAEMLPFLQMSE